MADLPTNFLDDILSDSMGGKRRFKITNLNGTSEEVTIEDISKYDQVGSTFGAGDIKRRCLMELTVWRLSMIQHIRMRHRQMIKRFVFLMNCGMTDIK